MTTPEQMLSSPPNTHTIVARIGIINRQKLIGCECIAGVSKFSSFQRQSEQNVMSASQYRGGFFNVNVPRPSQLWVRGEAQITGRTSAVLSRCDISI